MTCLNGECMHPALACDKRSVCLSEEECQANEAITYLSTILQGQCRQSEYQCARSEECISVSFLCDFKKHCADGSDEEGCDYPSCTVDEFQCANGQCISAASRCDLIVDCISGSDEEMCTDSSVGFQCYDSRWLPAHAQCDGQRDCSGKNWEDETSECGEFKVEVP
ncbi:vitellogenin receptor-like [Amphiura filiformis]|uniref:vitellogenin receptor-like n=1 Tax=Amphiura filiformis TaxID=82378 RepID=UPI003B21918C